MEMKFSHFRPTNIYTLIKSLLDPLMNDGNRYSVIDRYDSTYQFMTFDEEWTSYMDGIGFYELYILHWHDYQRGSRVLVGSILNGKNYGNTITDIKSYVNASEYEVEFNANNLASGVYFYTLSSGNYKQTKKILLLK
ncbi:hypothetical protein APF79_02590 [bacterium BRH_c32]|nr:MAG: hypothetical protein APF79_02590 [bacterium BRH_c32]